MSAIPIFSKLAAESLLSLYPIFVKKIGISMSLQLWTRLISYVIVSSFFVDWGFIGSVIHSLDSITLALVNVAHIFFSYEGFLNLDSGVSFAVFNTYPIMILLLAGVIWKQAYLYVLVGLAFFIYSNFSENNNKSKEYKEGSEGGEEKPDFKYGIVMILLAALTEAIIYFLIRRVKTTNHWNHVFISYALGAVLMTGYIAINNHLYPEIKTNFAQSDKLRVWGATAINGFIGSVGYFLRFFASYRLSADIYAPLSYFGIIMSFVYGVLFNNETFTLSKALGTLFIIKGTAGTAKI